LDEIIMARKKLTRQHLETLYRKYNARRYVHPDPLEFLYSHNTVADREVVGLVASSLAYGRVGQILRSVGRVLEGMAAPSAFVREASRKDLSRHLRGFRHRFTSETEIAALLFGAGRIIEAFGSLGAFFRQGLGTEDDTVRPALGPFAEGFRAYGSCATLIPKPDRGSACKRLNLYLRWMVRRDAVDPGGWRGISPEKLIIPLDTHMLRVARAYGLTSRNSADMRGALEITRAFGRYAPSDPTKYDFALTREGIWANHGISGG
jgi:uncharacterized protein (TIGR02757 family)